MNGRSGAKNTASLVGSMGVPRVWVSDTVKPLKKSHPQAGGGISD